jgi:hypothetical protein
LFVMMSNLDEQPEGEDIPPRGSPARSTDRTADRASCRKRPPRSQSRPCSPGGLTAAMIVCAAIAVKEKPLQQRPARMASHPPHGVSTQRASAAWTSASRMLTV